MGHPCRGGGVGQGAGKQKASLDGCLENQAPSQLGPNPPGLQPTFHHSPMKPGDWFPLGPAH